MIYDLIIIGGGAAGLFAGASLPKGKRTLILEKSKAVGKKLLISGASKCNLTHSGSIKEFLHHYGDHDKEIRSILYSFNNLKTIDFFESHGVPCFTRDDGKVFPKSLKAQDVLDALLAACKHNQVEICLNSSVLDIVPFITENPTLSDELASSCIESSSFKYDSSCRVEKIQRYNVICKDEIYESKKVIVATGGASYPSTGSDGSFFTILQNLDVDIKLLSPALVPISVHEYPYMELSGISFPNAKVSIFTKTQKTAMSTHIKSHEKQHTRTDSLLFTHDCFSGPAVLNIARYAKQGDDIEINYLPKLQPQELLIALRRDIQGNKKQISTFLWESLGHQLPKRFIEIACTRLNIDYGEKAAGLSGANLKSLATILTSDSFSISGLGGFAAAMVTRGGVALDEINLKTLELKKYPNLHVIGEALDIDGDTGGYNIQFAFSSGYLATKQV